MASAEAIAMQMILARQMIVEATRSPAFQAQCFSFDASFSREVLVNMIGNVMKLRMQFLNAVYEQIESM